MGWSHLELNDSGHGLDDDDEGVSHIVSEFLNNIPSRRMASIEQREVAIASLRSASNGLWMALDTTSDLELRIAIIEQGRTLNAMMLASQSLLLAIQNFGRAVHGDRSDRFNISFGALPTRPH